MNILISEEKPPKTERMGDYEYTKKFDIIRSDGSILPVSGWIIQLVNKETEVATAAGRILRSSKEISDFTCGNTNFMSDSYIECFPVKDGHSEDADIFSSGAVATCDKEGKLVIMEPPYEDDELPLLTEGRITHVGTNVFWIADTKSEVFHKLPWDKDTSEKAANGLWMLPADRWPDILAEGNDCRNMPIHTVKVQWGFTKNDSQLVSSVDDNGLIEGRNRGRSWNRNRNRNRSRNRNRNRSRTRSRSHNRNRSRKGSRRGSRRGNY